jgi:hypothetical protein
VPELLYVVPVGHDAIGELRVRTSIFDRASSPTYSCRHPFDPCQGVWVCGYTHGPHTWTLVGLRFGGPEPRDRRIDQNPFGELFFSELGRSQRDLIGLNNERPS